MNASRPSEHPPVREENVKTFRWDHRLQTQKKLFMAFIVFGFASSKEYSYYCTAVFKEKYERN